MSFLYLQYLALVLAGTIALKLVFGISFAEKRKAVLLSLILTTVVFFLWDTAAVMLGHWEFGLEHTLGIMLGNQPLEEVLFFLLIPFFGITLWEIAGKLEAARNQPKLGEGPS